MAVIFYLSDQPSVGPELPAWMRVVGHFTEYFLLASLWIWALAPSQGRRAIAVAAAISILYAITDEYHQRFVEGRVSDVLDVLTDTAGVLVACWVAPRIGRARRGAY
jgi:VanZ family protein